MENKEIYLEVKLKEINRDIMKLKVKKKTFMQTINRFLKN